MTRALADDSATVVDVRGLRMRYGTVDSLDGVWVTARRGEVLVVLGPNGREDDHARDPGGLPRALGPGAADDRRAIPNLDATRLCCVGVEILPPGTTPKDHMFFILGIRSRTTTVDRGRFRCPNEGVDRHYNHLRARRWFTVFFIPLIPLGTQAELVRCGGCGAQYGPDVTVRHAASGPATRR